jgi:nucleoside-diphosphate-sugar epimerase
MKILVTGGTGFLGSVLVDMLVRRGNDDVSVLSASGRSVDGVTAIQASIADREAMHRLIRDFDVVCHLAATVDESLPLNEIYRINVDGTVNVFDACIENGIAKVIYASSVGIYGDLDGAVGSESSPMNAASSYERTKKEVEYLIPQFRQRGLSIINLRPVIVYGPGSPMWHKTVTNIISGKPYIGTGQNKWPLVYVDDAASAFLLAIDSDESINDDFIIAGPRAYPYKDIVNTIKKAVGRKLPVPRIPLMVLSFLSWINRIMHSVIGVPYVVTPFKVKRFSRDRVFVSNRANEAFGYQPTVNLKEGVEALVAYHKEEFDK